MAQPKTLTFGKFLIEVESDTTPGTFVAPCGFTDRSLEIKADTSTTAIPDCDDNDLPAWNSTGVKALSASVSGQGVLSLDGHKTWRDWVLAGVSKMVRVHINQTLENSGGYYEGSAVLTSLKLDGTFGEKCKQTVAIESDGAWVWTDAAA